MTQLQASKQAQRFSLKYGTFWYVRRMNDGTFEPYAHSSDDGNTVATFYAGKEWHITWHSF